MPIEQPPSGATDNANPFFQTGPLSNYPPNPTGNAPPSTTSSTSGPMSIAEIITEVARQLAAQYGVDANRLTQIALAAANQESGGNPTAVGDNGSSFGLYQLHRGGELGNMSEQQAFNAFTNATVAIGVMAQVLAANPNQTDGWIAAAAQRPADRAGYAASINNMIGEAPGGMVSLGNAPALPQGSTGVLTGTTPSAGGGLVWPFPTQDPNQFQRVDQGWDLVDPNAPVLAAASGTIEYMHDPKGFGATYPVLILDTPNPNGTGIYYGHVVPTVPAGTHVTAGQQIATTAQGPQGNATQPGWLEIGWWGPNGPTGNGAAMKSALQGGQVFGGAMTTPASTTIGQMGIAMAQQNYPELAWMLQIPDIASDINTWAAGNYTPDEIAARLQGTPWYQRMGASFFTWISQQATNPSQAAQTFQEQLAAVKQTFAQLGLHPSDQQLQTFAYEALAQDWTNHPELEQQAIAGTIAVNKDGTFSVRNFSTVNGQLVSTFIGPQGNTASTNSADYQTTLPASYVANGLVSQVGTVGPGGTVKSESIVKGAPVYAMIGGQLQQNFDVKNLTPGTLLYTLPNFVVAPNGTPQTGAESNMAGTLQNAEQVFTNTAGQYLVPISKQATGQLVQQAIAGGTTDIATMAKTYFQEHAKSLYPTMAAAIDAGITPQAYTDPYRQVVSNLLGISPDAVNMMDPKYLRFVTQKDPKTGVPTAMSLYDAQNLVMSDPVYGYMNSQNAVDRATALAQGIGEMFGKVGSTPSGFSGAAAPTV